MTESAFAQKNMEALGVKSFASVKEQMAGLTRAYRDLAASGKASTGELAKALDNLRAKNRELYASISSQPRLDAARSTLGLTSHRELQAQIGQVKRAYAELASSGRLSMAELAQAKVAVGRRLDELKAKTNGWRESLADAKGQFIEAAAAGIGLIAAGKAAVSFESAMADVRKTVGGTPEEIADLGNELLKLSRTMPLSANELAKIAATGGQLGIASRDIKPFVEVTAKMATAFDMTAEEAGDAIGKLKNVFSLSIPEISSFGDAINQLGNTSAAREKDIVDVMLRIGGGSRQFGVAKEQAAALAAAMLSLGKPPEVAATSINTLLNRMQTATMQGGDFQDALARIGTSAEEMAQAVATDPQRAISDLLDSLAKLDGKDRAEVLTGLFGREFQDDIAVLVGGLDVYKKALDEVATKNAFAGAMQKEFEVRAATAGNKLKTVGNIIWEIGANIGTGFLPVLKAMSTGLKALLTPIADLSQAFPKMSAAIATVATGALLFAPLKRVFDILKLAVSSFGVTATGAIGGVATAATGLASRIAGLASQALLLGAAYHAAYQYGEWLTMRKETEAVAAAQGELERATKRTEQGYRDIAASTGVAIASMEDLDAAVKDGRLHYDKLTGDWKAGAAEQADSTKRTATVSKQVTGEALEAMKKKYQEYAAEVRRLQDEIAGRERSLAAELRAMARTGMSDVSAWQDQKREAEEYAAAAKRTAEEAKRAMEAGDTTTAGAKWKEAVALADEAKTAYKNLNTEVKSGDQVLISQQQALKTAMDGVKQAGELGIQILKEQQAAGKAAMEDLAGKAGVEQLTAGMDEAEKRWLENWETMQSFAADQIVTIERKLEGMVQDRHVTVWVTEKIKRALGGPVGFARGGRLPGYGGGDRISALLEAGEFVIRKEAVSKFGAGLFHALNSLRLPEIPRFAAGGQVGSSEAMTINFAFGGAPPVASLRGTREQAVQLEREFARRAARSSR